MSGTVTIAPVVKQIDVACGVEHAFQVFTREMGSWWPTSEFSISGDVREIVFEERAGGEVFEVSAAGERAHWATVLAWEPPSRVVIEWRVNAERAATEVEVQFAATDVGTRVELVHRGFEAWGAEATEGRSNYDAGWGLVLGCYVQGAGPQALG